MNDTLTRYRPQILSILRIMTALLLLQHGLSKFFGWPVPTPTPATLSMLWWAGLIEIVGSLLFLLGLFTRPVAFILSGHLAFAYFIGHAPQGFFPQGNRGELAALYSFVFLYFVFAGPGPWSVDAMWRGRRGEVYSG